MYYHDINRKKSHTRQGTGRKGYIMLAKIAEFFREYYVEFSHREG